MSHAAPSYDHGFNASGSTYFIWALVLSLALHALALMALHPLSLDSEKLVPILDVELSPPPKPPAPPPEPPKPVPQKPPVRPVKMAPTPVPVVPKEVKVEPPPQAEPIPPPVISAAPKTAELPSFTAPPPPESLKPTVTQDIDAARGIYANLLGREFAKHKQYPRLAQMRGWQGSVIVQLQIDASGTVISSGISQSSSFEVLDKQALEMVKKALPLPQPPEALRNHEFTIHVPVVFRLE